MTVLNAFCVALVLCVAFAAAEELKPKPVPRMQAVPQPYHQVSFQRDGKQIARYHFGPTLERPFVFPVVGPSGRPLTRMGHPHDPEGHGHHNSVWISHHDVNGANFWANRQGTRIAHQRIERLDDGADPAEPPSVEADIGGGSAGSLPPRQTAIRPLRAAGAALISRNAWLDKEGKPLLTERRGIAVHPLPEDEWMLVVDTELTPARGDVTLGKTPFGFFAVRMAKTIGVHDGAGTIRNSEGGVDEKGVFWKRAKWVDYSGAVADGVIEGITLLDHPSNPNHPSAFHVRNDGWMGASLTLDGPRVIRAGEPLRLRYGLYIHAGLPEPKALDARWAEFTKLPLPEPEKKGG